MTDPGGTFVQPQPQTGTETTPVSTPGDGGWPGPGIQLVTGVLWTIYRGLGTGLLVVGGLLQVAVIVTRDVFGFEPQWSVDAITLTLILGMIMLLGSCRTHIGFEIGLRHFRRWVWRADGWRSLLAALVCGVMSYAGTEATVDQYDLGGVYDNALALPLWACYLVISIGFGAACLRWLGQAYSVFLTGGRSRALPAGEPDLPTESF